MARPRKIGNEQCPNPDCDGFLQLGYIRKKTSRGRPTARYISRYWFRHNDSEIREHYVDNFIRPAERTKDKEIEEGCLKAVFNMQKIVKLIVTFPLTEEELLRWNREKEWVADNVLMPFSVIANSVNNEQLKNSPEFREAKRKLVRLLGEAMLSRDDKWEMGYDEELYKKYDLPKRLERNRTRNKELSKWHGKRTNDFTGIEPEELINSELKP